MKLESAWIKTAGFIVVAIIHSYTDADYGNHFLP